MKPRTWIVISLAGVVALLVFGQAAFAQENPHHYTIKIVPRAQAEGGAEAIEPALAPNLYGLAQYFGATPFVDATTALNADGSDLWPCFGSFTSSGGTSSENPDCPTIGKPSQPFPTGAAAIGGPAFVWSLAACNATSTSANFCGQTQTWYEDDSGDTSATDELIYSILATQVSGTSTVIVADSGVVDFGPNPFGGASPPADVIVFGDQNFGTMGQTGGINNGNCTPDFNYPLTAAANPGVVYIVAAGKKCGAAVSGPVTFTATTEIGAPVYTKKTTATACTPIINGAKGKTVGPPCFTNTWTSKFKLVQKWTIFLK